MIQTIDISLIPSDNKPVINVSQFDNISRVLRFNVFDDAGMEVPHVFDNTETVLLNIRKNDNNIVVITGVIVSDIDPETQEVTEQYLTFELTEQACACVGSNFGEVSITSGSDEVIGSCNFRLLVERSPLAGGISSQTAIDNLTTQIDQITEEVIGDNYYDKTEVDNLLDGKADVTDLPDMTNYYDKTEVDILLDGKADVTDLPDMTNYYDKTEVDNLLDGKADVSDLPDMTNYYDKTEVDNLLDDKANVTDLPDMSDYYTKTEVNNKIYDILPVGSSSGAVAPFNTALAKPLVSITVDENATKLFNRGINIWDEEYINNMGAISGVVASKNYIPVKPTLRYYLGYYGSNTQVTGIYGAFYDINKNILSGYSESGTFIGSFGGSMLVPANACYFKFRTQTFYGTTYNHDISINYPSTDTEYHPYNSLSNDYDLPLTNIPNTFIGDNNFFTDYGDITVQYKDTIQNYIDTRVNAVSNRSLSMQRTLETLEKSAELDKSLELERGDNNDDNAR